MPLRTKIISLLTELEESKGLVSYKYLAPSGAGDISSLPIQDEFATQEHNLGLKPSLFSSIEKRIHFQNSDDRYPVPAKTNRVRSAVREGACMSKNRWSLYAICFVLILFCDLSLFAARLECDLTEYQKIPGISADLMGDTLTVVWEGESNTRLRLRFILNDGRPTIQEFAVRKEDNTWSVLGRNLSPVFTVTTGIRRTGHDLPEENRWDVFWDAPLQHLEEVATWSATYHSTSCLVRSNGNRLEVSFPGVDMGIFSGRR